MKWGSFMREREKALERAAAIANKHLGDASGYPKTLSAIADAILEAQAEEAERACSCGNRALSQSCPHKERAKSLRAQIGAKP